MMVMVIVFSPGTNTAGGDTLPEIVNVSFPSTMVSLRILTVTHSWVPPVKPLPKVSSELTRAKSSSSNRGERVNMVGKRILWNKSTFYNDIIM